MIAIIAAVGEGGVIGFEGEMPWGNISLDLRRFKALTMGRPVVMGYKTLLAVAKVFPKGKIFNGRTPLVLTREPRKVESFSECVGLQDTNFVFELAKNDCVYIIGGENVYRQFVDKADVAYITRVHAEFSGDAFFPPLPVPEWVKISSEDTHDCGYSLSFETWARGCGKRNLPTMNELAQ